IITGRKAKELLEKDAKSVVGAFKRKMGTSESYWINSISNFKTPVELSTYILRELRSFMPPGVSADAAVITIPASFDTIQSNATKEAGSQAGFAQVTLLQEPVAASLAYANMHKEQELAEGNWLVYDLGGGTFDIALVRIKDGEMKVLDHEGDNFLGGTDFDNLIVEKILIPAISAKYSFNNLETQMKSASGKYNAQYYILLQKAEEAKILLSSKSSVEVVIDGMADENNTPVDFEVTVTRAAFNELITPQIDATIGMVKNILSRNKLQAKDILFTLMVGGSTYIPFVRQRTEEQLQIPINCEIDPVTAVAAGAAHYAATRPKLTNNSNISKSSSRLSIKTTYAKTSKEKEELFLAKITGDTTHCSYRITRADGGFDTGLKQLTERISEYLPLVENTFNYFQLTVHDRESNTVEMHSEMIGINSAFGISGQPLPEDICLEIDDDEKPGETKLLMIFQKNSILPSRKSVTRTLNKSIQEGSEDKIRINVLEGPHYALPEANKSLGYLEISARQIFRDIAKGSDIELTFTISESRDLTVTAYLNMADQEFKQTFTPKERHTTVNALKLDVDTLARKLENEIFDTAEQENHEVRKELSVIKKEMDVLETETKDLVDDDVTDKRYQLEDKKRKLAQAIDNATRDKHIAVLRNKYFKMKGWCLEIMDQHGSENERNRFYNATSDEASFMYSQSSVRLKEQTEVLRGIISSIVWRTPMCLKDLFRHLVDKSPGMSNQGEAQVLISGGRMAIESRDWSRLAEINQDLLDLLPKSVRQDVIGKVGF
ncbi:MAG TPA: Hsp70 family protein, partial [Chitinophaga sp.]|nr:Hsp70 family protein [Chitinophaga sp.]